MRRERLGQAADDAALSSADPALPDLTQKAPSPESLAPPAQPMAAQQEAAVVLASPPVAANLVDPGVDLGTAPANGISIAAGATFRLHSLPGSHHTIYLDFDGHTSDRWNDASGAPRVSNAYSQDGDPAFSAAELGAIQGIWQAVAEYFSPFNIDVTTEDPGVDALTWTGTGDVAHGVRVVFTAPPPGNTNGGEAHPDSFNHPFDDPVYVFAGSPGEGASGAGQTLRGIAGIAAHEVGHALGLSHDGYLADEYYGSGNHGGANDWGPIMGGGGGFLQWSRGEYYGATNTEDDLAIITTQNHGVTWRTDEAGNTLATATPLGGTVGANALVTAFVHGVISGSGANNDVDVYSFDIAEGGSMMFSIAWGAVAYVDGVETPMSSQVGIGMLDVKATLYRDGTVYQVYDDTSRNAFISLNNLPGGHYALAIDGTGFGDPMNPSHGPRESTEYGSLGQYKIYGTYTPTPTIGPTAPVVTSIVDDVGSVTGALAWGGVTDDTKPLFSGTGPVGTTIFLTEGTKMVFAVRPDADGNWTSASDWMQAPLTRAPMR